MLMLGSEWLPPVHNTSNRIDSRYGGIATHARTKTLQTNYTFEKAGSTKALSRRYIQDYNDPLGFVEFPIDQRASPEEQMATEIENTRRRRAQRITEGLYLYLNEREEINELQHQAVLTHKNLLPRLPLENEFIAPCPRFNEIRDFLFNNRLELALDTLDFQMPEHTLYNYIVVTRRVLLSADEWRAFLRICVRDNTLFKSVHLPLCYPC